MRFIAKLLALAILLAIVAIAAYTYGTRRESTIFHGRGVSGVDTTETKERAAELANKAENMAGQAATTLGTAMSEGALTAKIKSKMALDDLVSARNVNVTTKGSVVTLTGTVESAAERERAVRLAHETIGVTQVIDRLEVKKR